MTPRRSPSWPRRWMRWQRQRRITLIRHRRNLGFAASANAGMRAAAGRDVVLLNSDTLVAARLAGGAARGRLRRAGHRHRDAALQRRDDPELSRPGRRQRPAGPRGDRPPRPRWRDGRTAATAIDIPVGVGFCMYIRRACLDAVGLLRADLFAQGYGEENDFCLRARHLGWRHVAATGRVRRAYRRAVVRHGGAASPGAQRGPAGAAASRLRRD